MTARYEIRKRGFPPNRGRRVVTRPTEFTCFSYDDDHVYRQDDSSLRWYYHNPMDIDTDLTSGFERFDKHDDSQADHLDSMLKSIMVYEREKGKRLEVNIVTWRGMMTKNCLFIEENHQYRLDSRRKQDNQRRSGRFTPDQMSFWGYKFETLATLPRPWGEVSRTEIESRNTATVSNKAQYCSIVATNIGSTKLCLAGEIDALWGSKPSDPKIIPPDWVELKTSASIRSDRDVEFFHAKLMKFWIQSYLIGVPRIIVGFRSQAGRLESVKELKTADLPSVRPRNWDADVCIDFTAEFLSWLRHTIAGEGVWRIKRAAGSPVIEVFRVAEEGYGEVLTEEFVAWRTSNTMKGDGVEKE
ncbi:related to C.elegans dom-3 protein [Cephalotrichum gorgonifer]|uniref:Decapping nuclease n=1 Tax=Cephalotrichum gorgonifer TaxID=2041049 RepID=A0AAE8MV10_9PEZI|nr:related to C.elegans dom-3 protein [Cephalotrichum gorgonifer]